MIYKIGKQKLELPETGDSRKIRTPRQCVPYRDMAETCRTLNAICSLIPIPKNRNISVADGIARSGFWGCVFLEQWPDCDLVLNDEDEDCAKLLQENFPNTSIESYDLDEWNPEYCDVIILDFDAFTLRKLETHKKAIVKASNKCDWLIIADSAPFGFKFGNLRHYGVETAEEYFELLDSKLESLLGKNVVGVSSFVNAAMVLFGNREVEKSIEFLPPTDLFVSRGGKSYKGHIKKPRGFGLLDK